MTIPRAAIEHRIVKQSSDFDFNETITAAQLEEFLDTWQLLVKHYESHPDTEIHVETVREYLFWTDRLAILIRKHDSQPEYKELFQEALAQIEACLVEIVKHVENRLYSTGR